MPIQFACPHCGKQTTVADQFAGQNGPCAACGGKVTIPQSSFGGGGGMPAGMSRPVSKSSSSPLIIILAVVLVGMLVCGGIAVALLLPAVSAARSAAKRSQSMNNLKQIGLALHNYHDVYRSFPPAVVSDANGTPLYSGRVLLLPFLDQANLYERFDKNKAWNSPENMALSQTIVSTFVDPAKEPKSNRSDYVFVTGPNTIFENGKKISMAEITDGTSNTVMMIETAQGPNWAEPVDWNIDSGALPPSNHQRVRLFLYGDGSVRPIDLNSAQQFIRPAATRNGGEVIPF